MRFSNKRLEAIKMDVRRFHRMYDRDRLPDIIADYIAGNFEPKVARTGRADVSSLALDPFRVLYPICKYYKTSIPEISKKSRKKELVHVRHIAMYLLYTHTSLSLASIGKILGNYDHTSVIHARDRIAELMPRNAIVRKEIRSLTRKIAA
jgi:chromosomal replication initiation ATPase DnaA